LIPGKAMGFFSSPEHPYSLGQTQPSVHRVLGYLPQGFTHFAHEADLTPSAEDKNDISEFCK
jgi:hypothetical protein